MCEAAFPCMPEQFRLHAGLEHLLLFAGRPEGSHTIDSTGLRQRRHRHKQRQGTTPEQNSHPILPPPSQTCLDNIPERSEPEARPATPVWHTIVFLLPATMVFWIRDGDRRTLAGAGCARGTAGGRCGSLSRGASVTRLFLRADAYARPRVSWTHTLLALGS
jgi:hypothetical protein